MKPNGAANVTPSEDATAWQKHAPIADHALQRSNADDLAAAVRHHPPDADERRACSQCWSMLSTTTASRRINRRCRRACIVSGDKGPPGSRWLDTPSSARPQLAPWIPLHHAHPRFTRGARIFGDPASPTPSCAMRRQRVHRRTHSRPRRPRYDTAMAARARSTVRSMSSQVWARLGNMASYAPGAKATPRSSIEWKNRGYQPVSAAAFDSA